MASNQSEIPEQTDGQTTIVPVDIYRRTQIWKWLLNPRSAALPADISKEEIVGVFNRNMNYLKRFKEISNVMAENYKQLDNQ
jgi:hypothetical protein